MVEVDKMQKKPAEQEKTCKEEGSASKKRKASSKKKKVASKKKKLCQNKNSAEIRAGGMVVFATPVSEKQQGAPKKVCVHIAAAQPGSMEDVARSA